MRTPPRARASTTGHSSSDVSFSSRGFRARGFPAVPAVPASLLDGKEGSTVRVRQRALLGRRTARPSSPAATSSWTAESPRPTSTATSRRSDPPRRVKHKPVASAAWGIARGTGSKRPGTAPLSHAGAVRCVRPDAYEQRDVASVVVHLATVELACHAGGRGFEARRSRLAKSLQMPLCATRVIRQVRNHAGGRARQLLSPPERTPMAA